MINVTEPFLPPFDEYVSYLSGIWKRNWLTNNGPLLNELELRLKETLGVEHLLVTGNGTLALQIAIKALGLEGEIITTPFSYIATTSSVIWESCQPVFADINEQTFNIDPGEVEKKITSKTTAILTTHVFGNASEVKQLQNIATKHDLKIIYDAAHCFGVKYGNQPIMEYGDINCLSLHATKLFHTIEGGAIVSKSSDLIYRASKMRNFGHHGEGIFDGIGINGKNSEFHAAMGLCNLKYLQDILTSRREQYRYYKDKLSGSQVKFQQLTDEEGYNYSYFPVVFENENTLLKVRKELEDHYIYPRRYFYPSLSCLDYVEKHSTPISDSVSKRVLCLPMFHSLSKEDQDLVVRVILRTLRYKG
ncbi:DegT/DnrJ/EryC1/StrS family aminotransferase [Fulvivirga sp. M361]|uniref:DegT/DnrJ/EryC1/StrS family aminotransferase n=1 Tax=Fulvivirga sp. M361 TaxID=2594266 RepID=UPI0011799DAB|nr:DegT/DnrJ/EryC1/StrS family aminotransferase [Fulvivirga sp. M361]TRX50214.1 DegT/DnrJ/EryC1/StrS family aminotransferase [Fulvivirga sp. M361]